MMEPVDDVIKRMQANNARAAKEGRKVAAIPSREQIAKQQQEDKAEWEGCDHQLRT